MNNALSLWDGPQTRKVKVKLSSLLLSSFSLTQIVRQPKSSEKSSGNSRHGWIFRPLHGRLMIGSQPVSEQVLRYYGGQMILIRRKMELVQGMKVLHFVKSCLPLYEPGVRNGIVLSSTN